MRKLGVTHMAFYRGWVQGLPLRQVADDYLDTGMDLRLAKTTLGWVQDTLRRAALRHGKHGEARLLRLRIAETREVTGQSAELPSIDDFQAEFDPSGFYTFEELMVFYLERYPSAGNDRARKRAALLERQLRTLNWLEVLLVTDPVPADPIEAWLDPHLVKRLQSAGIATLSDLIARITEKRFHWYQTVPQLGEVRARKLVQWLDAYQATLGAIPVYARKPEKELTATDKARPVRGLPAPDSKDAELALAPLQGVLMPAHAADRIADNLPDRAPRISANNDRAALTAWLNAKTRTPASRRAYQKEGERLIIWAWLERGRTLAQLTVDDATLYRKFLGELGRTPEADWVFRVPQAHWCAPRNTRRHLPEWRPFEGALTVASARYALSVCQAFLKWLVKVDYLRHNIWDAVEAEVKEKKRDPNKFEKISRKKLTRVLNDDLWDHLYACAGEFEDAEERLRALITLRLALVTGLRLAELTASRYGDLTLEARSGGKRGVRWILSTLGKGGKPRDVPVPADVVQLLRDNLVARGVPDDLSEAKEQLPNLPLIAKTGLTLADLTEAARPEGDREDKKKLYMSESGIYKLFKRLVDQAVTQLVAAGRADEADLLVKASPHWVRHTTGQKLANAGIPATQIQQLLGHASVATTSIYTETTMDELEKSVNKVF